MEAQLTKVLATFDDEHAALLTSLRRHVARLAADGDVGAFAAALRHFVERLGAHFSAEEDTLRRIGYADLDGHREEHARLMHSAEALLHSLTTRFDTFDSWGVALYFLHWLSNHIRRQDEAVARHTDAAAKLFGRTAATAGSVAA
jgi:hemerythrin-like metal-binding protein